ncbi:Uncharacterized protein SCF082_LOCUS37478, partial [Durusdinium trenchii]
MAADTADGQGSNGSCNERKIDEVQELSKWVISALMRGEAPEVLAKFVAAQVPLQDEDYHQLKMELHLHSKQAMATVEEHREFGKPPPLPKELPLQQLRRNLAELDAIMARLAPKMEPLVQARQAPQAPPAPRPAVVQGLSG